MKKIMMIATLAAFATSVSAQKPAAPAAKPAAKPDAKVAAAPVATPAPVPAKKSDAKITVGLWGGYNISQRSDLLTAAESYGSTSAANSNAYETSKNGFTGGLDGWFELMEKLQLGLGVSYVRGFKTERTLRYVTGNITNTTQFNYLPIVLQARYFFLQGLYAGAGAGIALPLSSKTEATTTLPAASISTIPYSESYSKLGIWFEGRLGYELEIMENISLDVFGKFSYQMSTISFKDVDASGVLTAKDVKNNGFFITPALSVSMKF